MPVHYKIFPAFNVVVSKPLGKVTETCVLGYFHQVHDDPDYKPGLDHLIDNSGVKELDLDYAQMRNICAHEMRTIRTAPRRVTTVQIVQDDSWFGMARMYQQISETDDEQDVFIATTIKDAAAHLGLGPDAVAVIEAFCDGGFCTT